MKTYIHSEAEYSTLSHQWHFMLQFSERSQQTSSLRMHNFEMSINCPSLDPRCLQYQQGEFHPTIKFSSNLHES